MMLSTHVEDTGSSFLLPEHTCQRFTFSEIQSATDNFNESLVIGRGGFGLVYKCPSKIGSISQVAVKRLNSMSNQGAHEFEAEVKLLSKLRHGNLVSLIGYCSEGPEMVLVYEFMPNGTLEDHLHKTDSALSWLKLLEICIGTARGLDYLHTGTSTQHGVIHRDVKTTMQPELSSEKFNHPNLIKLLAYCLRMEEFYCLYEFSRDTSLDKYIFGDSGTISLSWVARLKIAVGAAQGLAFLHLRKHPAYSQFKANHILVDTDFNARLSDYEVENVYATPEWMFYRTEKMDGVPISRPEDGPGLKSEVYAFGVVLLEILIAVNVRGKQKKNLVKWATPLLANEAKLGMIMDPKLQHNGYLPKGAFKLAQLVSKCLQPTLDERPSMEEIVQVLCRCYEEEINSVCVQP